MLRCVVLLAWAVAFGECFNIRSIQVRAPICSKIVNKSHPPDNKHSARRRLPVLELAANVSVRNDHSIMEPREVCDGCNRPPIQCLCEHLPSQKISLNTHTLVLQHPVEFRRKNISTTPLIKLVLEHVQVLVGRSFDRQLDSILQAAMDESRIPLLLFPGSDAITLEDSDAIEKIELLHQDTLRNGNANANANAKELEEGILPASKDGNINVDDDGRKYLLVIVDGTWTQAKRMVRYSPILMDKCQQVQFTSTDASTRSIYDSIRKQPDSHCLSSLESCALTLKLLEPENGDVKEATSYLHSALKALVCIQIVQERKHLEKNPPQSILHQEKMENKKKRQLELESEVKQTLVKRQALNDDELHLSSEDGGGKYQIQKELNDGMLLRNLLVEDAPWVDSRWPYSSKKSVVMIQRQLRADTMNATATGYSCCLGIEDNGNLVGCIMRHRNGSLGILHVDEAYRRQGLGTILLSEASSSMIKRAEPLMCYIVDGNTQSEELFTSLGWSKVNINDKRGTGKRRAKRLWTCRQ